MIRIFTGDDRVRAMQEIEKLLDSAHETFDAADLDQSDLLNIFEGASLFSDTRKILLRDLSSNKSAWDDLPKYLNTKNDVILLETKLDKRTATFKEIKDKVEVREFKLPESANFSLVFDIYRTAKRDGRRAVKMLEQIKPSEDPIKFTGLLVSQALKDFASNPQGIKERKTLKDLAKLDLAEKTTSIDPWLLVESFLLNLR